MRVVLQIKPTSILCLQADGHFNFAAHFSHTSDDEETAAIQPLSQAVQQAAKQHNH